MRFTYEPNEPTFEKIAKVRGRLVSVPRMYDSGKATRANVSA